MTKTRAFTLIEILVVVAIIGLLVSITVPSVAAARRSSRSAKCRTNLHGIGQAMESYFSVHGDIFPCIAPLPSAEEDVANSENRDPYDGISVVLKKETHNNTEVFLCPDDEIRSDDRQYPTIGLFKGNRYFDTEVTSYNWNSFLNPDYDPSANQVGPRKRRRTNIKVLASLVQTSLSRLQMVYEYEMFHSTNPEDPEGAVNCLYADMHVQNK